MIKWAYVKVDLGPVLVVNVRLSGPHQQVSVALRTIWRVQHVILSDREVESFHDLLYLSSLGLIWMGHVDFLAVVSDRFQDVCEVSECITGRCSRDELHLAISG